MSERGRKLVIIGGGIARLSVGIHAQNNGFDTHIFEYNLELGGMCTAWHRDPYVIDGCIYFFGQLGFPEMPVIVLPIFISEFGRGQLSRPIGGSGRFRDAIVTRYLARGGKVTVNATVEEILVEEDRAVGIRLADGSQIFSDWVISTAGAHEIALRMLGDRYMDCYLRARLDAWPVFNPFVMLSLGVDQDLKDAASLLNLIEGESIDVGGGKARTHWQFESTTMILILLLPVIRSCKR